MSSRHLEICNSDSSPSKRVEGGGWVLVQLWDSFGAHAFVFKLVRRKGPCN